MRRARRNRPLGVAPRAGGLFLFSHPPFPFLPDPAGCALAGEDSRSCIARCVQRRRTIPGDERLQRPVTSRRRNGRCCGLSPDICPLSPPGSITPILVKLDCSILPGRTTFGARGNRQRKQGRAETEEGPGRSGDTWGAHHARTFWLVWLVRCLWRIFLGVSRVPVGE